MQKEKYCSHCGAKGVSLINYSKRLSKKSGDMKFYYYCRQCNTERMRRYAKTPEGNLIIRRACYRSVKKHYKKQLARLRLNYHVKVGNIQKPTECSVCKQTIKVEAHHTDYTKPLEVVWVCRPCHSDLERTL